MNTLSKGIIKQAVVTLSNCIAYSSVGVVVHGVRVKGHAIPRLSSSIHKLIITPSLHPGLLSSLLFIFYAAPPNPIQTAKNRVLGVQDKEVKPPEVNFKKPVSKPFKINLKTCIFMIRKFRNVFI